MLPTATMTVGTKKTVAVGGNHLGLYLDSLIFGFRRHRKEIGIRQNVHEADDLSEATNSPSLLAFLIGFEMCENQAMPNPHLIASRLMTSEGTHVSLVVIYTIHFPT